MSIRSARTFSRTDINVDFTNQHACAQCGGYSKTGLDEYKYKRCNISVSNAESFCSIECLETKIRPWPRACHRCGDGMYRFSVECPKHGRQVYCTDAERGRIIPDVGTVMVGREIWRR